LFGVFQILTDNNIFTLLDGAKSAAVCALFDFVFDGFQRSIIIDSFRMAGMRLLLAFEGTPSILHRKRAVNLKRDKIRARLPYFSIMS